MTLYELAPLPFAYDALEPYIDAETMHLHHDKHHQAYVNNLNAALEKYPELTNQSIETLLTKLTELPEAIQTAVKNNGGGHANHDLFWKILTPPHQVEPAGAIKAAINKTFGDFETFKAAFKKAALGQFGSGWAWLVLNADQQLEICATPNQDSPLSAGKIPLIGLDVWEHAYYKKYSNLRADYVDAFWQVLNWQVINDCYQKALK